MKNPFDVVADFEDAVADYAGAPHAVALDTGTIALFLACKYFKVKEVTLPKRTYVSCPCGVIQAGGSVKFEDLDWQGIYQYKPYPIIDSACRFTSNMYRPGTHWCLSFQYRKHLKIGRGGMILTDDWKAVEWYKLARFSGRHEVPLMQDVPEMIGWQCYMEPERAARGLTLLSIMPERNEDLVFSYPDLSSFNLYDNPAKIKEIMP